MHTFDQNSAGLGAEQGGAELERKLLQAAVERGCICLGSAAELLPRRSQENLLTSLKALLEKKLLRPCEGESRRKPRFRIYEPTI